jgi:nucleoside-diphosphate-sugar epimerase
VFLPARPGDIRRFRVSYGKAWRLLGWRPTVTLDDGLAQILRHQGLLSS